MSIRRVSSPFVLAALSMFAGGCTFAQIAQVRKPKPAQAPESVSFPEAERMIPSASYKYQPTGKILRTYITHPTWEEHPDGSGRYASLVMIYQREGGALVKGENGNEKEVCFQYSCTMSQYKTVTGLGHPVIECDDSFAQKVTCTSVAELPPGIEW